MIVRTWCGSHIELTRERFIPWLRGHVWHFCARLFGCAPRVTVVTLVLLLTAAAAHACGKERWAIKTLADPFGQELLAHPNTIVRTTVSQLVRAPAPTRKQLLAAGSARWAEEKTLFTVVAVLVGYKGPESDGDYHIVIADPAAPKVTMVVEIPAGDCFAGNEDWETQSQFAADFGRPGSKFRRLSPPVKVQVTGVGFFDFIHGQTGVARNGFELHPVLRIDKLAAP